MLTLYMYNCPQPVFLQHYSMGGRETCMYHSMGDVCFSFTTIKQKCVHVREKNWPYTTQKSPRNQQHTDLSLRSQNAGDSCWISDIVQSTKKQLNYPRYTKENLVKSERVGRSTNHNKQSHDTFPPWCMECPLYNTLSDLNYPYFFRSF